MTQAVSGNGGSAAGGAGGKAAIAALIGSAALWGLSWYPYRLLEAEGLTGLWAIIATELAATVFSLALFFRKEAVDGGAGWAGLRPTPVLLVIGLLGGATNTCFILGTLQGEVLRVTLLLYLAPLWTLFLSRWLLNERINAAGMGVVALSLVGAALMMGVFDLPGAETRAAASHGADLPRAMQTPWLADALGLVAGLCYAGFNVSVRRASGLSVAGKTFYSSLGSVLTAVLALAVLALASRPALSALVAWPVWPGGSSWLLIFATGLLLVGVVVLMQYGLMRLPATRAIVIMVSELVFAALFAWWLVDEQPGLREWLGGALILGASLLSARIGDSGAAPGMDGANEADETGNKELR